MTTAPYDRGTLSGVDLLGLSFSALRQQKVRTILTIAGVVIGTFALVLSLSVGRGVDRAILALFHDDDRLRKISVSEKYEMAAEAVPPEEREPKGSMSDAKRRRISKALVRTWARSHMRKPLSRLNAQGVERLRALDHVAKVEPVVFVTGKASLDGKDQEAFVTTDNSGGGIVRTRLLVGRLLTSKDGQAAIVHEYLLYRLGLAGDADGNAVLGRTIRLEYRSSPPERLDLTVMMARRIMNLGEKETRALESALKRMASLVRFLPIPRDERDVLRRFFDPATTPSSSPSPKPSRTYSREFTIVGVIREQAEGDEKPGPFGNWNAQDADILLPIAAAEAFYVLDPEHAESGFGQVFVTVDREDHVKEVSGRISAMGYNEYSLGSFTDTVRLNVLMITFGMAFVAIVALFVAAVGITNTMIMSVLERTHEIGVMKALGARDRHIQLVFLVEGVVIGLAGSSLGLGLGWLASFPGDAIAKSIMEPQTQARVRGTLFVFPTWLVVGVPLLVCLITTLAALYPAFRAARVDPVTSLRHE
ncbi:MAG: ABC transporter permease [Isosphaerales bacterium]